MSAYRPLPEEALKICEATGASPRLVAHLILVHDTACRLVTAIQSAFPEIELDRDSILWGASTHDIGKAIYPEELLGPGGLHELHGPELLLKQGVSKERSRFAFSHANWDGKPAIQIEDLLVALADNCWKGKRLARLETAVVKAIAQATGKAEWQVFATLDDIVQQLAAHADERLAWQAQFPATASPA